jgi:dUTP pyrophosphatase
MHINIQVLNTVEDNWLCHPTYSKAVEREDCGLDIPMPCSVTVPPRRKAFSVGLGIKTEPDHAYMMVPRSSITKTPIRLANSVGIIDKSYRGELIAKVDNLSKEPFILEMGKCYFQIVAFDGNLPTWDLIDNVNETLRGEGGFGSTTI